MKELYKDLKEDMQNQDSVPKVRVSMDDALKDLGIENG